MKRNGIRLKKLEDKLIGNSSDIFRLSDLEILERIEGLEFKSGRMPTQKFSDMKNMAIKTKPIFTPKIYQRMREEQAERNAEIASINDVELDDHLDKLIIECEMDGTFKNHDKSKKETLC
jgi:hypothetical protein